MSRRRHTPEQIIRKLAEGQKLLAGYATNSSTVGRSTRSSKPKSSSRTTASTTTSTDPTPLTGGSPHTEFAHHWTTTHETQPAKTLDHLLGPAHGPHWVRPTPARTENFAELGVVSIDGGDTRGVVSLRYSSIVATHVNRQPEPGAG